MNDLFVDACRESNLVAQVASEEMGDVKEVGRGRFSVVLDPLDGSSNVRSNNIFGTILGIFDRRALPAQGRDLFAAGYLIYGPATTLVYATRAGVHEFVQGGAGRPDEFFLIEEGLRLPPKGKLFGVGGHRDKWIPEVKAFVKELDRELMNLPGRQTGGKISASLRVEPDRVHRGSGRRSRDDGDRAHPRRAGDRDRADRSHVRGQPGSDRTPSVSVREDLPPRASPDRVTASAGGRWRRGLSGSVSAFPQRRC